VKGSGFKERKVKVGVDFQVIFNGIV
jgi:hypothetical protein